MPHVVCVRRTATYLHVTVTGDNTPRDVQEYIPEVHQACIEHNCPYVLIEENLAGPSINTLEIFQIISSAAQPSPAVRCIAYVDVNPEHDQDRLKFAETVARNRGMLVKVFPDLSEAQAWLTHYTSTAKANGLG